MTAAVTVYRELESEHAAVLESIGGKKRLAFVPRNDKAAKATSKATMSATAIHRAGLIKAHDDDDEREINIARLDSNNQTCDTASMSGDAMRRVSMLAAPATPHLIKRQQFEYVRSVAQWHLQVIIFVDDENVNVFSPGILTFARDLQMKLVAVPSYKVSCVRATAAHARARAQQFCWLRTNGGCGNPESLLPFFFPPVFNQIPDDRECWRCCAA
jgi:hypothetical protein